MNRRPTGSIPSGRAITRKLTDLGREAKQEYLRLKEGYKAEGMSPREAIERAVVELRVLERWEEWRQSQAGMVVGLECGVDGGGSVDRGEFLGVLDRGVAATAAEVRSAVGSYCAPVEVHASSVGREEMSLAEQVAWAKKWVARIQNGEEAPTRFPSEGALFWLQSALSNRREFEKVVLRVESPVVEGESLYLVDGQHQLREIEKQLKEALRECGERLMEVESGFVELLRDVLLRERDGQVTEARE